jgi:hypothetical protein
MIAGNDSNADDKLKAEKCAHENNEGEQSRKRVRSGEELRRKLQQKLHQSSGEGGARETS